tara:strand:- start:705 stop:1100 length:396 start_codon:yes stop_codon:yes gene_type:complete
MRFLIFIFLIFSLETFAHHPGHKIEANKPYPSVNLEIYEDNMDGYNLFIKLENFILTPMDVGKKNKSNSGHIHLYVNDIKIGRVYSNWFHIPGRYFNLKENIIRITLNSNLHESFAINGNPIESEIKVKKE